MANKNADRFLGFADVYENARPRVPAYPAKVLCRYLGRRPQTVVDLGCGTGLSTEIWPDYADTVIGVEPSEDMFAVAAQKTTDVMTFRHGTGEATGLPDECADIVICSQSFHWMEPVATLREGGSHPEKRWRFRHGRLRLARCHQMAGGKSVYGSVHQGEADRIGGAGNSRIVHPLRQKAAFAEHSELRCICVYARAAVRQRGELYQATVQGYYHEPGQLAGDSQTPPRAD